MLNVCSQSILGLYCLSPLDGEFLPLIRYILYSSLYLGENTLEVFYRILIIKLLK